MTWTDWMPELHRITDPALRKLAVEVLTEAAGRGGWQHPDRLAYVEETAAGGPPVVRDGVTLIQHLRLVAAAAAGMAEHCNEIVDARVNVDHVLTGALLHDVGLFAMLHPTDQGPALRGPLLLRHPFVGARLAADMGMDESVVHIIATHSVEGESTVRTPESALVHWADWGTYDVMRAAHFPWAPQERAFYYYPAGERTPRP
ncbi:MULTISPECIES: HD domain-containing protein [unclassified Streptomyces]|uniref:HD domain-containing protein n=1 Tax=unclassified Streptomyces TaxID=2593676 RepID=UPI000DAC111A|nr:MULTISPECIES: HD domain-containing protein [unclassified Streptomyces]PZT73774.1 hypothetical protein DNK55_16250 [Streptomyces sp. AC1-42T]PZT83231.1 hypothetical protein DNK56_15175 [Streptomyces sp. AC1-42W]